MSIDKARLKALAETAKNQQWYTVDQLIQRAVDGDPAELMTAASPDAVLELLAEIERLEGVKRLCHLHKREECIQCCWPPRELTEIDRFKAENEKLQSQVKVLQSDANSWQSGYDEGRRMGTKTALSERETLRKDAERYRWLRKTEDWDRYYNLNGRLWIVNSRDGVDNQTGKELDDSIDAAMKIEVSK